MNMPSGNTIGGPFFPMVKHPLKLELWFRRKHPQSEEGSIRAKLILDGQGFGPFSTRIPANYSVWARRKSDPDQEEVQELVNLVNTFESLLKKAYQYLLTQQEKITPDQIITYAKKYQVAENRLQFQLSIAREPQDFQRAYERFALATQESPVCIPIQQAYQEYYAHQKRQINDDSGRHVDQISTSTWLSYPKRWRLINAYLISLKQPDFPVGKVNYPFVTNLKEWLTCQPQANGMPYRPATINKTIAFLKTLITYAQKKGFVEVNPILSFKCRGGSVADPKPLTKQQINQLETCELSPVLRHYCDSWLVAGELCLHHADFMRLPKFRFKMLASGIRIAQNSRAKQQGSKLIQTIDITDRAERILAKYGGPEGLCYKSSAYYSKVLKTIARVANLRNEEGEVVRLQFGMGRDTGLTQRVINGATSVQLSKIAGWSKPVYANRYIGDAEEIVSSYVKNAQSRVM
ncbi:phage integrase SAM-like domain-containing protein [Larkinella sp.]|uniref:phage integrase SAM-like domain-containing protein n=1 Tax=Larkinella sp. TaxID=2034517 RepID=UPI003BACD81F